MKTTELTWALLDYWTGRAEGIEKGQLDVRQVQRPDPGTPDIICVRIASASDWCKGPPISRYDPSTNWALCGPLLEKYKIELLSVGDGWCVSHWERSQFALNKEIGTAATVTICRAVVRAAFGDEVEDLP